MSSCTLSDDQIDVATRMAMYTARQFGVPADDRDDVAQDVLLKLVDVGFDPSKSSLPTWVSRLASCICIDRFRRGKLATVCLHSNAHESNTAAGDTDAVFDRGELDAAIEHAELSDRQWAVLRMMYAGMTRPQIAAALNIPRGTVASISHRARQRVLGSLAKMRRAA